MFVVFQSPSQRSTVLRLPTICSRRRSHVPKISLRWFQNPLLLLYIQKLFVCLFFSVPTHPVSKDNKMRINFWHVVFLAVLSGCCLFRHTVEWTWPANWTRTKQNESLTKVQKVFTLHDTSLIYIEPVDLNLRVTWGWKSTLKSTNLCTTYKDGSVI